jgi:hypothetical protein
MNNLTTQDREFQDKVFGIFISTWGIDENNQPDFEDVLCHNLGVWTDETKAQTRCRELNKSEPALDCDDDTYFVKSIIVRN